MAHKILLFRNKQRILGSTGFMNVDGRYNQSSIRQTIIDRNKRVIKNFPNEVADAYAICDNNLNYNDNNIKTIQNE